MFAVRPICAQDPIFKMSSVSPESCCFLIGRAGVKYVLSNSDTNKFWGGFQIQIHRQKSDQIQIEPIKYK